MGRGKYHCKKGSLKNLTGEKKYWNKYLRRCMRTKKGGARKPCSMMSQQGLSISKRCKKKGFYPEYQIRGNWKHV